MFVVDAKSLGLSHKTIIGATVPHIALSTHGCFIVALEDCVFTSLILKYDLAPSSDYAGQPLKTGGQIPGVESFTLTSGSVLVIDK